MAEIESIGVKELRRHLSAHLVKNEPFAITKNGLTLGYYIPTHHAMTQEQKQAFRDVAAQFDKLLEQRGWDSEDLIAEAVALREQDKTPKAVKKPFNITPLVEQDDAGEPDVSLNHDKYLSNS